MPPRRALAALILVGACSQTTPPPAPLAGAPPGEARAVETTGRTGLRVLGLTQGTLRACSGAYDPPTSADTVRTTDLACTGGVRGNAVIGPDPAGGRSVRWALETGESGHTRL